MDGVIINTLVINCVSMMYDTHVQAKWNTDATQHPHPESATVCQWNNHYITVQRNTL